LGYREIGFWNSGIKETGFETQVGKYRSTLRDQRKKKGMEKMTFGREKRKGNIMEKGEAEAGKKAMRGKF